MAWSTRELAELASVTVKTVRHYHAVGLLAEPERTANGYKQYRTEHLVRLLRIRRLHDMGVPLAQIAENDPGGERLETAIAALDHELEAEIDRLTRIRANLTEVVRHGSPTDVPSGFEEVASLMSSADRALVTVFSSVFTEEAMADLRELVAARQPTDDEFDALPPDADERTMQDLAERMAPGARRFREEHGWMADPVAHFRQHTKIAGSAIVDALADLYNPAQREVIRRMNVINAVVAEQSADSSG